LMMAIANSALGRDYYDSVCGNKLYAGRRRYITQYVERFPIPDPTQPVVGEIVEAVQVLIDCSLPGRVLEPEEELNRLVRRSFGLE
jgi:adenine-specific DNA-methyltransferase